MVLGSRDIIGLGSASPRGAHDCPYALALMPPSALCVLSKVTGFSVLLLPCDHQSEVTAKGWSGATQ